MHNNLTVKVSLKSVLRIEYHHTPLHHHLAVRINHHLAERINHPLDLLILHLHDLLLILHRNFVNETGHIRITMPLPSPL